VYFWVKFKRDLSAVAFCSQRKEEQSSWSMISGASPRIFPPHEGKRETEWFDPVLQRKKVLSRRCTAVMDSPSSKYYPYGRVSVKGGDTRVSDG